MAEEELTVAERIARRRAARATQATPNNGVEVATEDRTPRQLDDEPAVAEAQPENAPLAPTEFRRRKFVEPVAPPAEEVQPPKQRKVVTEEELAAMDEEQHVDEPIVDKPEVTISQSQDTALPPRMERVKEQAMSASQALIIGMLEHMRAGEQLFITRNTEGLWSIVIPTSMTGVYKVQATPAGEPKVERTVTVPANGGKLPKGFEASLLNPKYVEWKAKWRALSDADKDKKALELGVALPDKSLDKLIYAMQLSMAVQEKEKLAKYKPEYSTKTARDQAKDKALKGLPY